MVKEETGAAVCCADTEEADVKEASREDRAMNTTRNYMLGAIGAGLIPVPALDLAAITGIQLKMLHSIGKVYGIEFKEEMVRTTISSLISGIGVTPFAARAVSSLVKVIPGIGTFIGSISLPVMAGATTWALGKVFVQHFESGGTFLDFDPTAVREHFRCEFEKGKAIAEDAKDAAKDAVKKS